MTDAHPSPDQIDAWIAEVRCRTEEISRRMAPLLEERERLKRQIDLLERLRESLVPSAGSAHSEQRHTSASDSVRDYVIARATELLDEEAGPLHINELHARFLRRGFEVPGAGAPVNITAHIRHSEEIITPKRGFYVLVRHAREVKT